MNFLLSVLFILFLGQEKYHSAEATALNNTTTNKFMFLSDGKYCRLFPKWMKANHNLSECDINVEEYKYWVEGFLLAIVSFVGILGNFASCFKFARQRTQKLFHYLLLGLAAFDMVYLVAGFHVFCYPSLKGISCWTDSFCMSAIPWGLSFAHIGLMGSLYMTVCLSVERYLALIHPFWICRKWLSFWHFFLPTLFFVLIFKIPKFLEFNQSGQLTSLRQNFTYVWLYIGLAFLLFEILIPFAILITCNTAVLRLLRQHRDALPRLIQGTVNPAITAMRKREVHLALISVYIAIICLFCHLLRIIPTIWEVLQRIETERKRIPPTLDSPDWLFVLLPLINLSLTITSSSNFYIYWVMYGRPCPSCAGWGSYRSNRSSNTTDTTFD